MIYRAPFYAVSKAVYGAFSSVAGWLQWFDNSVPIDEIEALFKGQANFSYGVFGVASADCQSNKDLAVWDCSLNLDIYSNYKGRKAITKELDNVMNYISSDTGWNALQALFLAENYQLVSINVGALAINPPLYSEVGVWQSGTTTLNFRITQKEA